MNKQTYDNLTTSTYTKSHCPKCGEKTRRTRSDRYDATVVYCPAQVKRLSGITEGCGWEEIHTEL
jgi:rRNA maturation protein Nop10